MTAHCYLPSSLQLKKEQSVVVTEEDLEHLCNLVERKDGGPPWKHMMDHCTPTMSYQAWQRDPEVWLSPFKVLANYYHLTNHWHFKVILDTFFYITKVSNFGYTLDRSFSILHKNCLRGCDP
ncbi:hypothetical protein CsSME_00029462 [Camellia sinensis var. sinensis]